MDALKKGNVSRFFPNFFRRLCQEKKYRLFALEGSGVFGKTTLTDGPGRIRMLIRKVGMINQIFDAMRRELNM